MHVSAMKCWWLDNNSVYEYYMLLLGYPRANYNLECQAKDRIVLLNCDVQVYILLPIHVYTH